jgi:hypothetical protein
MGWLIDGYGLHENVALSLVLAFVLLISYLISRLLYSLIAFQRVPIDTPECNQCGYNLYCNVSGVCPECGAAIVVHGNLPTPQVTIQDDA